MLSGFQIPVFNACSGRECESRELCLVYQKYAKHNAGVKIQYRRLLPGEEVLSLPRSRREVSRVRVRRHRLRNTQQKSLFFDAFRPVVYHGYSTT